jgi:MerR family transcriptional regulator, copper efflux regulator
MATAKGELTVTGLARASGVKRETIRFYEQRGLLDAPPRSAAGYRLYRCDDARRVRFIKSAQNLGFSLEEIAELLTLRSAPEKTCATVKARAEAKIADIERKITALAAMKAALTDIAASCGGGGASLSDCPILAALDADASQ